MTHADDAELARDVDAPMRPPCESPGCGTLSGATRRERKASAPRCVTRRQRFSREGLRERDE
eukprot:29971-Pelagococcus_subviridis.AAC.6